MTSSEWHEWDLAAASPDGWSHHGLAVLPDGTIAAYHPGEQQLLRFDRDGTLLASVPCEAVEAHDLVLTAEADALWLADCGHKLCRDGAGSFEVVPSMESARGQVLKVGFDGVTLVAYGPPDHPTYAAGGPFLPTGVAVDERGLWVADGYGSNLVHLLDHDGEWLVTIEGFDCPHGVIVDRRGPEPLLYIAERGEHRLCVHDLDGGFVRYAGEGSLVAPCSMAVHGDRLLVADLVSRVTMLDAEDQLVEHLGADREATSREGWPNTPTTHGRFSSPHGVAVQGDDVYVTEWRLGGRWIRTTVPMTSRR